MKKTTWSHRGRLLGALSPPGFPAPPAPSGGLPLPLTVAESPAPFSIVYAQLVSAAWPAFSSTYERPARLSFHPGDEEIIFISDKTDQSKKSYLLRVS